MTDLTRRDLEDILNVHLKPIRDTIVKLEDAQERIIEILAQQARMDEKINHLDRTVERCLGEHDGIYIRLRDAENKTADRMWQAAFAMITGIVAFIIGKLS